MIPESLGYHHQYVCSTFRNVSKTQCFTRVARASIGNSMNRVSWHRETKPPELNSGTHYSKFVDGPSL